MTKTNLYLTGALTISLAVNIYLQTKKAPIKQEAPLTIEPTANIGLSETTGKAGFPISSIGNVADSAAHLVWKDLANQDDDAFIDSLKSMGMPSKMIHQFSLGRVVANHRATEQNLLFEQPYWKDISSELVALKEASESKVNALSQKILGDPYAGMDAVERIRRQYGAKKWKMTPVKFQEGNSILYHIKMDQLEAEELRELSKFLTEEQLRDYQLKHSWKARHTASMLKLVEPEEDEFLQIMQAEMEKMVLTEAMNKGSSWGDTSFNEDMWLSQEALLDELTRNLGEERYQDYNRTQLPAYSTVRALQDMFGFSNDVVNQILDLRMDMQQTLMSGLGGFPGDKTTFKGHKEKLQNILSEEAYKALVDHAAYHFPRGFFSE